MKSEGMLFFSGEPMGTEAVAVTPMTFIKRFCVHMRDLGNQTDTMKIEAFADYLTDNSPAEQWFNALQNGAAPVTTWVALEAVFQTRFPGPVKAERTAQEWDRELAGMKLTLTELGTTVDIGSTEVYTHIHFTSRLLKIAWLMRIDNT
jgi:hypothetical protein